MAATQPLTETQTFAGKVVLRGDLPASETKLAEKADQVSLIGHVPGRKTDVSRITGKGIVVSGPPSAAAATPQFVAGGKLQKVNAVISELTEESVSLDCFTPSGSMETKLPIFLVAPELRTFGQPVTVSLSREQGYRAPLIQRREIDVQPLTSELKDIEAWLDAL